MKKYVYKLAPGDQPVFSFEEKHGLPTNHDPVVTTHGVKKYLAKTHECASHPALPAQEATAVALVQVVAASIRAIRLSHQDYAMAEVQMYTEAHGEEPACLVFIVEKWLTVKFDNNDERYTGFDISCRIGFIALPGTPDELRDAYEVPAFSFEETLLHRPLCETFGAHLALTFADTVTG